METEILKEVVYPVIAGVIVWILTSKAQKSGDDRSFLAFGKRLSQDILIKQVERVYAPIDDFIEAPYMSPFIKMERIRSICEKNKAICIPLSLKVLEMEREKEISTEEAIGLIDKVNSSNYNQAKKVLGYPYSDTEIKKEYIYGYPEVKLREYKFGSILQPLNVLFWVFMAFYIFVAFWDALGKPSLGITLEELRIWIFGLEIPMLIYHYFGKEWLRQKTTSELEQVQRILDFSPNKDLKK